MKQGDQTTLMRNFADAVRPESVPRHVVGYHLPEEIYELYLKIYDRSRRMVEQLGDVLTHPDHQLIMIGAAHLGYDLPDLDLFRDELESYRQFLDSFDPAWAGSRRLGRVFVPNKLAQNLTHMVDHNCVMLRQIFNSCLNTDYLRRFKEMKQEGLRYTGPAAIREIDDVIARLWAIRRPEHEAARPQLIPAA